MQRVLCWWYDMIWYDMIWYDMIWYDMFCFVFCNMGVELPTLSISTFKVRAGSCSSGMSTQLTTTYSNRRTRRPSHRFGHVLVVTHHLLDVNGVSTCRETRLSRHGLCRGCGCWMPTSDQTKSAVRTASAPSWVMSRRSWAKDTLWYTPMKFDWVLTFPRVGLIPFWRDSGVWFVVRL
jgi:hypothetical protein